MAAIFGGVKYSLKLAKASFALFGTVFEIQAFLRFAIFAKNSKWSPFLAGQNFLKDWVSYSAEVPCGSKTSSKSLYLARISR